MDGVVVNTKKAETAQPRDPRIFQDRSGKPSGTDKDRVNVLGVGVSSFNMDAAVATLIEARKHGQNGYVCVTGVHGVIESQRDPELKQIHNRSFLTVPDGMPTVWMGREQGFTKMGRVYGPDLMLRLMEATANQALGTGHWALGDKDGALGAGNGALGTVSQRPADSGQQTGVGNYDLGVKQEDLLGENLKPKTEDLKPKSDSIESNFLYPSQDETGGLDVSNSIPNAQSPMPGAQSPLTHFLFGATEETLVKLKTNLEERFPGVQVVGTFAPPFRPLEVSEEEELRLIVSKCKPDFFWVGLSTPKQERFMYTHSADMSAEDGGQTSEDRGQRAEVRGRTSEDRSQGTEDRGQKAEGCSDLRSPTSDRCKFPLEAGIMLGVGAAFDIHAGHYKDSPEWIKNSGLQWLHRLCKEPRRLWRRYLDIVPTFLWLSAMQLLGVKKYTIEDRGR